MPGERGVSVTYANDALGPDELDELVCDRALGVALAVGLNVAKVTDVAVVVGRAAVGLAVRVDWRFTSSRVSHQSLESGSNPRPPRAARRRCQLTMRAGRGAAVGVVTEGVDVHATLGIGVVAGDIPDDLGGSRLGLLLEDDGAADLGVTPDDGNWGIRDQC